MIWQKYGVTQERGEERLTKKVRKKYVGGGSTAKECDATHSKKDKILGETFFSMLLDFCCIFYECIC